MGEGPADRDDSFGSRIAITYNIIVVGAPSEYLPTADSGKAYTIDLSLGIKENDVNALKIYPNPTNGELFITENMLADLNKVEVYQIDGKLVSEIKPFQNTLSLNEFQKGLYLLKFIYSDNTSFTRKIVKN